MVELSRLVNVGPLGVYIGELPDKRGVSIVAGLLERRGFELADNANFMPGGNETFDMDI